MTVERRLPTCILLGDVGCGVVDDDGLGLGHGLDPETVVVAQARQLFCEKLRTQGQVQKTRPRDLHGGDNRSIRRDQGSPRRRRAGDVRDAWRAPSRRSLGNRFGPRCVGPGQPLFERVEGGLQPWTGACRRSTSWTQVSHFAHVTIAHEAKRRRGEHGQNGVMTSLNSFGSKMTLNVQGRELTYYSLRSDSLSALGVTAALLHQGALGEPPAPRRRVKVNAADIEALARWGENPSRHGEAAVKTRRDRFTPERVLMQDLTGVPAVVDLARCATRSSPLGGDPNKINPLVPVELVIDHSVILERSGTAESFEQNVAIEYERNVERYTFLKWASEFLREVPRRASGHGGSVTR